jgi:predicted transcriptional regulator
MTLQPSYEQEQAARDMREKQKWAERQAQREAGKGHPVKITSIDISFGNALSLMIKLILASVPAAIVAWGIFALLTFVLFGAR